MVPRRRFLAMSPRSQHGRKRVVLQLPGAMAPQRPVSGIGADTEFSAPRWCGVSRADKTLPSVPAVSGALLAPPALAWPEGVAPLEIRPDHIAPRPSEWPCALLKMTL